MPSLPTISTMNAKNRTGVYRRDYHRPNRLENKTMHRHSFGHNVPVNAVADPSVLQIPKFTKTDLVQRALASWRNHHDAAYRLSKKKTSVEQKCFEYIRHRQTTLDAVLARLYGAAYLVAIRQFCDAVAERYDWLRDECERYYKRKRDQKKFNTFRVIKRPKSLTSLQSEEFNADQVVISESPLTEEEEIPLFFRQLNSLDQERFLYLPPFLKPAQVRARRFGENANDRWWEWEEELDLKSDAGRPIDTANLEWKRRRKRA